MFQRPSSVILAGVVFCLRGVYGMVTLAAGRANLQYSIHKMGRCTLHHTVAWRASIADVVAADVAPVVDGIMTIQNSHFLPQKNYNMIYAYYGALGATRARFVTPTFRQLSTPWIRPINLAIVPLDEPNMADYSANPLLIRGLEELQLEGYQTSGGAAVVACIAGLASQPIGPSPSGDIIAMRGTGATAAVPGGWTNTVMMWQDTLPNGQYAVVGLEVISTTCIAGRLIFEDQVERPGCLGQSLVSGNGPQLFRYGNLGVWGRFNAFRIPSVEVLCNAADATQEIYLHLVRIG